MKTNKDNVTISFKSLKSIITSEIDSLLDYDFERFINNCNYLNIKCERDSNGDFVLSGNEEDLEHYEINK